MKKNVTIPYIFESLSDLHRMLGLPNPLHPMISLIENKEDKLDLINMPQSFVYNFYKIAYKKNLSGRLKYGQGYYDFDEGGMFFKAPNQLSANAENNDDHTGFTMLFHPDFLA